MRACGRRYAFSLSTRYPGAAVADGLERKRLSCRVVAVGAIVSTVCPLRFAEPTPECISPTVYPTGIHLSYGKQRGASVDILYDLFKKLDPVLLEASFYRHLQQMRRRGLLGRQLRAYMDSTLIEKSPNSTFEKAAWITIRKISYYGYNSPIGQ